MVPALKGLSLTGKVYKQTDNRGCMNRKGTEAEAAPKQEGSRTAAGAGQEKSQEERNSNDKGLCKAKHKQSNYKVYFFLKSFYHVSFSP